MNGLILHCGASQIEEGALRALPTPEATQGESGRVRQPIPHALMLDLARETARCNGLRVRQEALACRNNGNAFFGLLELETDGTEETDHATVIGVRNGHEGIAAGLTVGARVFVCDNLAFSGEVTFKRAHTRNILRDLPGIFGAAFSTLLTLRGQQNRRYAAYRQADLPERDAHSLILRAFRAGVIGPSRITKVLECWENPPHAEFTLPCVWSLFNAFTEVFKPAPGDDTRLLDLPTRTQRLHGLLDAAAGFTLQ